MPISITVWFCFHITSRIAIANPTIHAAAIKHPQSLVEKLNCCKCRSLHVLLIIVDPASNTDNMIVNIVGDAVKPPTKCGRVSGNLVFRADADVRLAMLRVPWRRHGSTESSSLSEWRLDWPKSHFPITVDFEGDT